MLPAGIQRRCSIVLARNPGDQYAGVGSFNAQGFGSAFLAGDQRQAAACQMKCVFHERQ